jgi:hypothetical protein
LPPQFDIEYSTDATYHMKDLTVESWLNFAEDISRKKKGKEMWEKYLDHMFVKTNNDWYGQSIPVETPQDSWWDWIVDKFNSFFDIIFFKK